MDAFADTAATQPLDAALMDALEGDESARAAFVRRILDDYRPDELPGWGVGDLADLAADFWRFGHAAPPQGEVRLAAAPAADAMGRPLDVLMVAEPDRPFLVDSVMGEIGAQGLDVRAMFHPVVDTSSGKRSMILVVLGAVGEDRREAVVAGVEATLADVDAAVADFPGMAALIAAEIERLAVLPQTPELSEQIALLRWIADNRFVLLGVRSYIYAREGAGYAKEPPRYDAASSLGILRDTERWVLRRESEPSVAAADFAAWLEGSPTVTVAKSNLRSRVHRRAYMDYVSIRRCGPDGMAEGEVRFVGLFTADAYEQPVQDIPLIRAKAAHVLERLGGEAGGHSLRRLRHIVETYPRDELFQVTEDELYSIARGVLHLYDRPRVGLFCRLDRFDRFLSALVFLPRDRYDSDAQGRIAALLASAWGGRVSAVYPSFSDGPLARLHLIVGLDPGKHPTPDHAELEAELAQAVRTWGDRFEAALREGEPPEQGVAAVLTRWRAAFPAGYREANDAADALADLAMVDAFAEDQPLSVRVFRRTGDPDSRFRFKLYVHGAPAPLSDVLPILENMGLRTLEDSGFPLTPGQGRPIWTHEYLLEDAGGQALAFDDLDGPFGETFMAVWTGQAESDGFNRLVLELGVSWRQASLVRALGRWRQQSGLDPSRTVQEAALRGHPGVARLILDLFTVKFDPAIRASLEERKERASALQAEIEAALQQVASLDADRVLRRLAGAVTAMVRTNYFQLTQAGAPKAHISFKIESRSVADLPAPKPYREIFVASPRVEGVHLRFGPVARGGLRWSDRRDDYRTEVLGLVKAQQVKNAVIVPVGAKGCFYPKQLPREGGPAARAEAIEAYKVFLAGLLDLTDNYDDAGAVVRPQGVIAWDADDPYLVVAADKGTATFSDIANGEAIARGFWLGDAFASGGSAGYDHKAMGITARGAWEAVKRHFRELDKDIQTEPFTVVGVGDMSGDVFGNGMLLSKAIKLIAAFDHRHIFLDPAPDPASSYEERARLFALPTSSWADYDPSKISWGGGVFPRTAKSIALTPEVRAALNIEAEALPTEELIRAILTAPVELLYLGGIGAYVKSPAESAAEVMDKANDAVRVDGTELRVQVVGEGANLGVTQAGRVAFARTGGHINTDAIDNSAGVDTSDHEVNIKILLRTAERSGDLKPEDRGDLLAAMTDEVAAHVLSHNYAQTLALTLQQAAAVVDIDAHGHFMDELVAKGRLDRRVEGLPGPKAMTDLKAAGLGLTRPELAVLMAYGKLELCDALVAGRTVDDPWFETALQAYFPTALAGFEAARKAHPLRREIVATVLSNRVVDMAGPAFANRLQAALGCSADAVGAAFEAALRIFRLDEVWRSIGELDLIASAEAQTALYLESARVLRAQTYWIAARCGRAGAPRVGSLVEAYQPAAEALIANVDEVLSPFEREASDKRRERFEALGAPPALSRSVARLRPLTGVIEAADLAAALQWPPEAAARLRHAVGAAVGLDRLKAAAAELPRGDHYERMAVRRLIAAFNEQQTILARAVADGAQAPASFAQAFSIAEKRLADRGAGAAIAQVREMEAGVDGWTFARLTLADAAIKELTAGDD